MEDFMLDVRKTGDFLEWSLCRIKALFQPIKGSSTRTAISVGFSTG